MPGITASSNSTTSPEVSLMRTILDAVSQYCTDTREEKKKVESGEGSSTEKEHEAAAFFIKNLSHQHEQQPDPSFSFSSSSSPSPCEAVRRHAHRDSISSSLYDHLTEPCRKRESMSSQLFDYLNDNSDQAHNNNSSNAALPEDQTLSVVKFLESQKVNSDLIGGLDTLRDFDDCERKDEEGNLVDFVCEFDRKYQMAYRKGITLSQQALALKLLCKARLRPQEVSLVQKGIDFSRTDGLYEEAKQALVKLAEYQEMKKGFRRELQGGKTKKSQEDRQTEDSKFYLILDSACSSTLCGKKWLDKYLRYLGEELSEEVEYSRSERSFIFGGGKPVSSLACCRIPAFVAGKMVSIRTDVVPNDLPLIYSLSDMKKAGVKLDFTNDTAQIFGQLIHLKQTESGHYSVPVDGVGLSRRMRLRQLSEEIQALQELVNGV